MVAQGRFDIFAILLKFIILFNAHQRASCEVVATDTCGLRGKNVVHRDGDMSRVDIPKQAGSEGINLQNGMISLEADAAKLNQKDTAWSFKFYVKIGPPKTEPYGIFYFSDNTLHLAHLANDSFSLTYQIIKGKSYIDKTIVLDNPKEDIIIKSTTDDSNDSDWVELIAIKMKVSNKKKRTTTSDNNHGWKMIGIEYSKHSEEDGYLKLYINGKLFGDIVVKHDEYLNVDQPLTLSYGEFSCLQYSERLMGNDYFEDFNLHECMEAYEGEPKQMFLDCEKSL